MKGGGGGGDIRGGGGQCTKSTWGNQIFGRLIFATFEFLPNFL